MVRIIRSLENAPFDLIVAHLGSWFAWSPGVKWAILSLLQQVKSFLLVVIFKTTFERQGWTR